MQGNPQLDTTMIEYQSLQNPPELNQQLLVQIDSNIKGQHWSATYQCITMIRSICKYHPEYTSDIFVKYGMTLIDLFNNSTTLNIKNIFKLLREVFMQGRDLNIETLTTAFLPLIIKKAANDSGQIKQSCQELMTIVSTHCCYPRIIQVCTELSCDKNLAVSQLSIKLLSVIIMNIGQSLTQLNSQTLQIIMKGMSILINGKRNNMKTSALDVCIFICNQIGSENYLQLMNYSLLQQEINTMGSSMQTHRAQKQKGPQLADYIKEQKTQRQSGGWNQYIR